jgi:hypothetical protein
MHLKLRITGLCSKPRPATKCFRSPHLQPARFSAHLTWKLCTDRVSPLRHSHGTPWHRVLNFLIGFSSEGEMSRAGQIASTLHGKLAVAETSVLCMTACNTAGAVAGATSRPSHNAAPTQPGLLVTQFQAWSLFALLSAAPQEPGTFVCRTC